MITTAIERELTAEDRCDACSAAAKVVSTFINGELMFCGHHARLNKEKLILKSVNIFDPDGELRLLK
jgi:hypothetical protein